MSLYRPKDSTIWWMDFHYAGQRIRESTKQPGITRAREVQDRRKQELRDGASGIRKKEKFRLFRIVAEAWLHSKPKWAPRTRQIATDALKHLLPAFGSKVLTQIEATDIHKYQSARTAEGAANRTVNIEVGYLRQIIKRHWARIQPDVEMLPEREDVGYALPTDEETVLLAECGKSRSRLLLPFVILNLETGSRFGTLQRLQWKNIDSIRRCLTFGKDKTRAGSGREIPLSDRAMEILTWWADQFPNRQPNHYVFLHEKYAGLGATQAVGFGQATVCESDPTQPFGSLQRAWERARERAGLPTLRIHDLRHSAVSRMIVAGVPLPIIAKIVGWAPGTLARMAARYGHFSLEEMRRGVESISPKAAGVPTIFTIVNPDKTEKVQ
jgi:integrase